MGIIQEHHREWYIPVPWGKLALVSRGHPDGYPVLLVHGRQDSSSVFEPIIELMTGLYHFVSFDMPGNGLSDPFPPGPKLMRFHFLAAMEFVIEHLGWRKFIFIGHSMGCEQGLFYNVIHPGRISQMILLDAGPTFIRMQVDDHIEYQKYYESYYENYVWENFVRKPFTREMALQALERQRNLTRKQSQIILARNFREFSFDKIQTLDKSLNEDQGQNAKVNGTRNTSEEASTSIGNEKTDETQNTRAFANVNQFIEFMREHGEVGYLSWDNRLKNLAPQNYGNDCYFALFKTIPPTLLIAASDGAKIVPPKLLKWRQDVKELLERMATLDNFHSIEVDGGHDVHFTHPERVAPYINAFLKDGKVLSKL